MDTSHNQPVYQVGTRKGYITSQNHGYVVEESSLPEDWEPWFRNVNDQTNEGIRHKTKPFRSVQFHPEFCGGPRDTSWIFRNFVEEVKVMPILPDLAKNDAKVLVLGSGGLSIGQAGEFDYSGSQAIRALREEGIDSSC